VLRGQVDSSARLIRWFELAGWAYDVRWPQQSRIDARRAGGDGENARGKRATADAA
jgi:stearoyl-CoA desaturase (delta-9 desaturase)